MHLYVVSTIQNLFPHKGIIVHKIQAIKSIWFNISLDSNISIVKKADGETFFPSLKSNYAQSTLFDLQNPHQNFSYNLLCTCNCLCSQQRICMYACMYWNRNSNFKILNYSRRSYDQGLRIKILYLTLATASSLVKRPHAAIILHCKIIIVFLFIILFYIIFLKF